MTAKEKNVRVSEIGGKNKCASLARTLQDTNEKRKKRKEEPTFLSSQTKMEEEDGRGRILILHDAATKSRKR